MDNTTYPSSDTNVNEDRDYRSLASKELDFVDHWVNLTVEKEISRGFKLREDKLRLYPPEDDCEEVNIDLVRPPCVDMSSYSCRKSSRRRNGVKIDFCSPRSNSPMSKKHTAPRAYTSHIMYSRPNTPSFKSKYARCPMSIAELAVPTKRQCIDTWRNKCDVLPAFMVERLRQQIMDEKPIVQIKEAISSFKRRKPRSIKSIPRSKKIQGDLKLKNKNMVELRNLCVIFANKIAQRLITPQNLKLTPELDKISKVVTDELSKIIQNRKNLDAVTSKKFQADISDKISIWIATILEDTSYKILEEDLKVIKHDSKSEDVIEERLETLVGKLLQRKKTSELEEEEGPVLDIIDDLVDNVVITCEPQDIDLGQNKTITESTSKASCKEYSESIITPNSVENNDIDSLNSFTNITNDTANDKINQRNELFDSTASIGAINNINSQLLEQSGVVEDELNNHIQDELLRIVDFVVSTGRNKAEVSNLSSDEGTDFENKDPINIKTDVTEKHKDLQKAPGNSELTSQIRQVLTDPKLERIENVILNSEDSKNDHPFTVQNDEADNDNVSDVSRILEEESIDDKDKKVKFSEVHMGVEGINQQLDSNSATRTMKENGHVKERVSWHSSTDIHNLVFAPPNLHLLSDADESWPDDIAPLNLKPSASINRSSTSLGKILENDEKFEEDEIHSALGWEDTHQTELEILEIYADGSHNITHGQLEKIGKPFEQHAQIAAVIADELKTVTTSENIRENIIDETFSSVITIKTSDEKSLKDNTVEADVILDLKTRRVVLDSSTISLKIWLNDTGNASRNNQATTKEKHSTEADLNNLESDTNVIYKADQIKLKRSYAMSEPKHDYKVYNKTAPSWLRYNNGKGEPSEDAFQDAKSKGKIKETEIRNWCKDLDRIFVNLEMWNDWVDKTCKNIMHLKKKKEVNKYFVPNSRKKDAKHWISLKKNIDKDAVLWTKLHQSAYERLKSYKNKTKIVSTEYCMICNCKKITKRKV